MVFGKVSSWRLWYLLAIFAYLAMATASRADFELSRSWFVDLGDEDRIALQTDLTLAGFYDAIIDGAFGPSTYRALTEFQEWNGDPKTGVLTEAAIRSLSRASQSVVDELDLQIVQDEGGKLEIAVPRALLPDTSPTSVGTAYTRPDGLMRLDTVRQANSVQSFEDLYYQLSTQNTRRKVTYQTFRDGYFVVSGVLDGEFFYTLMFAEGDQTTGFTLRWTERYRKQGSIVSLFLASFASPWDAGVAPTTPIEADVAPSQVLPASDSEAIIRIGNFLVSRETPGVIGFRGDIGPSTPLDFRRAVRAAGTPKLLMLASDGGYVSSALLLAYEVRELGLATYVLPDTGCYSACAFVFFAGTERQVDGALGVHQVWGDDTDASAAQTVVSDILEAFTDFGVRQEVTSVMLRTLPHDMYVFSSTELRQWGIQSGNPLSIVSAGNQVASPPGIAVVPSPKVSDDQTAERTVPIWQGNTLSAILAREGLDEAQIMAIERVFRASSVDTYLRAGTALKIRFRPSTATTLTADQVTFHREGQRGAVTFGVTLADNGEYLPLEQGIGPGGPAGGKGPRRVSDPAGSYVQLASQQTEEAARKLAEEIASRFGPLFAGADLEVQRVDLGQRGVFYRVRVSAPSPAAANVLCDRVKSAGGDCFVL